MIVLAVAGVLVTLGAGLLFGWFPGVSNRISGGPRVEPSPGAYYSLTAETPTAYPDTRLALGSLALDDYLQKAVDVLGRPASSEPDIFGTVYRWTFPGGASLMVSAWDDTRQINGVIAVAPSDSPIRFSAFGGVVVGGSTLREVVAAWGPDYQAASHANEDFVVSYVECVGPYPVVVKFDQLARAQDTYATGPGSPLWDMPVTSLLIAYADEPAGSSGCSTSSPPAGGVFQGIIRAGAHR